MDCCCICVPEEYSIDFSVEENEDLEEIDENELIEDAPPKDVWKEINDQFENDRRQIKEYNISKNTDCDNPLNPAIQFLVDNVFPLFLDGLEKTIIKAKELECVKHQKNAFNSIDFIAELLWNLNPLHPERKENWKYIFDMDWAVKLLTGLPRPYYPFSWIWSNEYAVTKIAAAMRGHWVRCRDDVQEMRLFWKALKLEREEERQKEQQQQKT